MRVYFSRIRLIAYVVSGCVCLFLVAHFWAVPHQRHLLSLDYWRNVMLLTEAMRLVATHYVDESEVGFDQLTAGAVTGMLSGLDEHSTFLARETMERLDRQADQYYVGIGVEIEPRKDGITVIGVFPGSGAEEVGVEIGDRIVEVDGENTEADSPSEIVLRLRGESGTVTQVVIARGDPEQRLPLSIERRAVNFPSIRDVRELDNGILYFRLTHFGGQTYGEFVDMIEEVEAGNYGDVDGLILDLRRNPGGGIVAALDTLDLFVPRGSVLLSTKGRSGGANGRVWLAERGVLFPQRLAVVVLVDRYSASAAEILAGGLQDIGRAVVVGEPTVGKGSVQSVYRFGDGAGFKLTTAMYSLPSGRTIHGAGITPDVVVEEVDAGDGSEADVEVGEDRRDGEESDAILAKGIEEMERLLRADGRSVNGASSGD